MNNYEEKRQNKLEYYKKQLIKSEENSDQYYESYKKISTLIPPGQPILIGHHSEKRHRNDLKKMDNYMRKSIEEKEKVEYYKEKIKYFNSDNIISSDDPEALNKLKTKLKERLELQEYMKQKNKEAKQKGEEKVFMTYQLSNNNQNINRLKKRIELLEKRQNDKTKTVYDENGIKIIDNVEDNRLQIFFPDIPSVEMRNKLKKHGFRWSRYNGCWQRFRSNYSTGIAIQIIKK